MKSSQCLTGTTLYLCCDEEQGDWCWSSLNPQSVFPFGAFCEIMFVVVFLFAVWLCQIWSKDFVFGFATVIRWALTAITRRVCAMRKWKVTQPRFWYVERASLRPRGSSSGYLCPSFWESTALQTSCTVSHVTRFWRARAWSATHLPSSILIPSRHALCLSFTPQDPVPLPSYRWLRICVLNGSDSFKKLKTLTAWWLLVFLCASTLYAVYLIARYEWHLWTWQSKSIPRVGCEHGCCVNMILESEVK